MRTASAEESALLTRKKLVGALIALAEQSQADLTGKTVADVLAYCSNKSIVTAVWDDPKKGAEYEIIRGSGALLGLTIPSPDQIAAIPVRHRIEAEMLRRTFRKYQPKH